MGRRSVIVAALLALCGVAHGQSLFNLFQPPPSAGVMKGSPTTYVTTNAAASDVITLFNTGATCTSPATEFLRADGVCAVPAGSGSGSVTSVNYAAPTSLFSCTGGPITGSGTITCTYATSQTATELFGTDGAGNVSLFALTGNYVPPIQLNSTSNGGVANTLGAAHGGTGAATLTAHGVMVGEGTSAVGGVAAMSLDTLLQGQGASADPAAVTLPNCGSGTQALAYSTSTHAFSCQTISAGTGTVTSVGMTVPSVMSVSPATITTSGTFALSFAGSQAANQGLFTPNGTTGALGLRSMVAGDMPPANLACSGNGCVTGNLPHTNLNGGVGASPTTCWFGDDTWKPCTASGTVTSVGITVPSWLSVSPATITTSGTFAINGTAGQPANQFIATPSGLTGAVSLRALVPADFQALSPTWTGTNEFVGVPSFDVTQSQVSIGSGRVSAGYPSIEMANSSASINSRAWELYEDSNGKLILNTVNDADSSSSFAMSFSRSGIALSTISLGNSTDNPTYQFIGTGTTTFGGLVSATGGFSGSGASITGINASNVSAGTLASARLPTTIAANTTGNASTASALATTPSQCTAGNYTTGITTSGNANCNSLPSNPTITLSGAVSGSGTTSITTSLNTAISPTLTGNWIFSPISGTPITVTAPSSTLAASISGPTELTNVGKPLLALNSSGTMLGLISNPSANLWSLGYGSSATTAGTSALSWNATGNVIVAAPTTGQALSLTGANGQFAQIVNGSPTGVSHGLFIDAGIGSSDIALDIFNQAETLPILKVTADGGVQVGNNPPGGSKGSGTINVSGGYFVNGVAVGGSTVTGTFTGTLTGMTSAVTATFKYRITGSLVSLWILSGIASGISNSILMTLTGLPVAIEPSAIVVVASPQIYNNNVAIYAACEVDSGGTITFIPSSAPVGGGAVQNTGTFTASGAKGLTPSWQITYDLEN